MNLFRTLTLGAVAVAAFALNTPAQARDDRDHDRDSRDFRVDHRHHQHYHSYYGGQGIAVEGPDYNYENDSGVTVAFGGHVRHHHHYRVHDR